MTIEPDTVRALNEAYAGLGLSDARIAELPIELNQLKAAIETSATRPDFASEPADFRAALLSLASPTGAGR